MKINKKKFLFDQGVKIDNKLLSLTSQPDNN